jgi:hypothetical protein
MYQRNCYRYSGGNGDPNGDGVCNSDSYPDVR